MIVYNNSDLANFSANRNVVLPGEESDQYGDAKKEFHKRFPFPFYSPSIFIRLGLFLLTTLMVLLLTALIWLLTGMPQGERVYGFLFLFVAGLCFLSAEFLARKKKHFQSGADESLHLSIAMLIAFGIGGMLSLPGWMVASIACITSLLLFLRYMNFWMAGLSAICCYIFLSMFLSQLFPVFVYSLPLALLSLGAYYLVDYYKESVRDYYSAGLTTARYCILSGACLFGNYLFITTVNHGSFSMPSEMYMYKITAIILPILVLAYGFRKRDLVAIHVGMLMILFSVYTVYVFMNGTHPYAWMAVCGGALIVVSVSLMRWLKNERAGFIYQPVKKPVSAEWIEILLAANASQGTQTTANKGFGGGDFGGGGASGSF